MTLARTWSVGLAGVHGAMVEVEVDMANGVPHVALVGLPDAVVRQSVDRVRAAVQNAVLVYMLAPSPTTPTTGRSGIASFSATAPGRPGPSPPPRARK